MRSHVTALWTLAILEMIWQTSSFRSSNRPAYNLPNAGYRYQSETLDFRYQPELSSSRLPFTLQAALRLDQTVDIIKETVLLSQIAGHYVKDIRPKGYRHSTSAITVK